MGVRISVYAVDLAQLEIFASQSLHDLLWFYADQPCSGDSMPILHLYEGSSHGSGQFLSKPNHGVTYWKMGKRSQISKENAAHQEFLSLDVGKFFASESSFALMNLLECFSACPSIEWVYEVTTGNRRWWIGSLLDQAETKFGSISQHYLLMTDLLQKMLRGYNCGKSLPEQTYSLKDNVFPIIPDDDTNLRMSAWSSDEIRKFLKAIDALMLSNPQFKTPPEKVGIAPQHDSEWNSWVYDMIQRFKQISNLTYENLSLISFIDT